MYDFVPSSVITTVFIGVCLAVLKRAHEYGIAIWEAYGRRTFAAGAFLWLAVHISLATAFIMLVVPFFQVLAFIGIVAVFIVLASLLGGMSLVLSWFDCNSKKILRVLMRAIDVIGLMLLDWIDLKIGMTLEMISLAYARRDVPSRVMMEAAESAAVTGVAYLLAVEELVRDRTARAYVGCMIVFRDAIENRPAIRFKRER